MNDYDQEHESHISVVNIKESRYEIEPPPTQATWKTRKKKEQ